VALASQRVRPARLEAMGFTFRQPSLPEALRGMLK
jgi:NAD dependent epimerase/dehydratase family enzyme